MRQLPFGGRDYWLGLRTKPKFQRFDLFEIQPRQHSSAMNQKNAVPTAVMYGEKTSAKLAKSAKALAALIPGADLLVVPKTGHMVKPETLAAVLMKQIH